MVGSSRNSDESGVLADTVRLAADKQTPLVLRGGGSKAFYGRLPEGQLLDISKHRGIIDYEPTELVITARAGTSLRDIKDVLAQNNQQLPFEPPEFGGQATIGGVVAAGLSGPGRPYFGSVRDFLLGIKIISGRGELATFGGQVMKNVAGYDVSRLMAGSLGTLGVILEVSLKILPRSESEITLAREVDRKRAIAFFNECAGKPLPVTGTCHINNRAYLRLAGTGQGVEAARTQLGGEILKDSARFWGGVREHAHVFFQDDRPLWRISVASTANEIETPEEQMVEWGGALRWLKSEPGDYRYFSIASERGGHATLFRHGLRTGEIFQPLPPALMQIQRNLKQSFDPRGIFNPGRIYRDF